MALVCQFRDLASISHSTLQECLLAHVARQSPETVWLTSFGERCAKCTMGLHCDTWELQLVKVAASCRAKPSGQAATDGQPSRTSPGQERLKTCSYSMMVLLSDRFLGATSPDSMSPSALRCRLLPQLACLVVCRERMSCVRLLASSLWGGWLADVRRADER